MQLATSQPPCPTGTLPPLPLELWTRILASTTNERELGRLWLTCRRVSRLVKAATEAAFVQQHLRRTSIYYGLGCVMLDDESKRMLSVTCGFDRLSADGERAFFRDHRLGTVEVGSTYQEACREAVDKWREAIAMYLGDGKADRRYDLPPHIICLRGLVMDTDLPGLRVDFGEKEVSFEWKKALSLFFGELEYIHAIEALELSEKEDEVVALKDKVNRGEVSVFSVLMNGLSMIENISDRVSKHVRRLRFRRWHKRHGCPLPERWFEDEAYEEREKLRELREMKEAEFWAQLDDDDDDGDVMRRAKSESVEERHAQERPGSDRAALGLDIAAYYEEEIDDERLARRVRDPDDGAGTGADEFSEDLLGRSEVGDL